MATKVTSSKLSPALKEKFYAVSSVITDADVKKDFTTAFTKSKGDIAAIKKSLSKKVTHGELNKIELAHSIASISNNSEPAVKAVDSSDGIKSLRDLALNHNTKSLSELVKNKISHSHKTDDEIQADADKTANTMMKNLFHKETSAVLQGMANRNELPISNSNVRSGVASFFANQPEFNIRTTSVYDALKNNDALKGIDKQHHSEVINMMKNLQRVQAVSHDSATLTNLMSTNLKSAHQITEMPKKTFLKSFSAKLGENNAKIVYSNAAKIRTRNELVLGQLKDAGTTTNTRILSNSRTQDDMVKLFDEAASNAGVNLSWETLFGNTDMCDCEDCNSVYSPAAYLVELFQYLRNDNLNPTPPTGVSVDGTVLGKFFDRRPDLGCLELTCENVNTILPYIDLVNEVLEGFIVHTHGSTTFTVTETITAAGTTETDIAGNNLETWNTKDETTSELLAQAQHTNYKAYCILKHEVYPFTLPYHQPIDAIRIFLNSINTSRYELMKSFQSVPMNMPVPAAGNPPFTDDQKTQLVQFIEKGLRNAIDAEYLLMTEEEYVILTKNAFKEIGYYNIVCNKTFSTTEYQTQIGVRPLPAYYGYTSTTAEDDMNNQIDPDIGLRFVKKQFLKRTGTLYTDLISILKTRFINPCYPSDKALTIMDSIRLSYRFLQTLVVDDPDPKKKYAKLISVLEQPNPAVGWLSELSDPGPCQQNDSGTNISSDDLEKWVLCNFERVGKLIVLDANDTPYFPITGFIYAIVGGEVLISHRVPPVFVGTIDENGVMTDPQNTSLGQVSKTDGSLLYNTSNKDVDPNFNLTYIDILDNVDFSILIFDKKLPDNPTNTDFLSVKLIGYIVKDKVKGLTFINSPYASVPTDPVKFIPAPDSCDITKVTIQHLDGSKLEDCEWDKIHRFIRLWHKLGWTIDETDKAIMALGCAEQQPTVTTNVAGKQGNCFSEFKDDCNDDTNNDCGCGGQVNMDDCNCGDCDISQDLIHQLVYTKKLLDTTGLEITRLLTFWNNISVYGDKDTPSLYARLFLTANMLGVDTVFKADNNGNYLATPQKISDHIPVLMAAFNIKAEDISNILKLAAIDPNDANSLNLKNVTDIYRYSLLMRIIGVKSYQLLWIVSTTLFGDPFADARTTYKFIEKWGRMEDAGFSSSQLNYVINNADDNQRPLTPRLKTILQLAKNIYDGLNKIDTDNPDASDADTINDDFIRRSISQLYGTDVVEQIIAFLNGTTVYTTNAPLITDTTKQSAFDQALAASADLKSKIKYDYNAGQLQVTGILTTAQITAANALSTDPKWPEAIHRVNNQAVLFYNDILDIIFQLPYLPGTDLPADARTKMLQGDDQTQTPPVADVKRKYFITVFQPYLRQQLYIKFLIGTLSDSFSSSSDVTSSLIQNILIDGNTNLPIIETFKAIKNKPSLGTMGWLGYLIPNADDIYTFVITGNPDGTKPVSPFTIDGVSYNISLNAQGDPSNLWFSDPIKLKNGRPYLFNVNGLPADMSQIKWRTSTSPASAILSSVLLPDCSDNVKKAYIQLQKATIIINGFDLGGDEVDYLQKNSSDFDNLDFNKFLIKPFFRLEAYCRLKKSLPSTDTNLISFFNWTKLPDSDPSKLNNKINELTQWVPVDASVPNDIDKLITTSHFNLTLQDFANEKKLLKLQKALYVSAKISMDINLLFTWAIPTSKFWICHSIAESIQKTIKARYKETDWEQFVKPLDDKLRVDMRDALVSYLLVEPRLVEWGVVDADSLFEFFLIDTEMDSCMETSRIKQAINSVQLFVQRCFLGLEEKYGVSSEQLDRNRWDWMQREVLWVANRKVFLYPENWIEENLRDDKSQFYKELESALLQKDINTQTVEDALKAYLYNLDEVANMKVVGVFIESTNLNAHNRIHVFSRTRNAPFFFYYRYYDIDIAIWTSWEKMEVNIPSYDLEGVFHQIKENGCYLIPALCSNRLLAFFPHITKKTRPASGANSTTFPAGKDFTVDNPIEYWEIKMAWSEYRNGKWTQEQLSKDAKYHEGENGSLPLISEYEFVQTVATDSVVIDTYYQGKIIVDILIQGNAPGTRYFFFKDSIISLETRSLQGQSLTNSNLTPLDFHYLLPSGASTGAIIHSLQSDSNNYLTSLPDFSDQQTDITIQNKDGSTTLFSHPYSHQLLGNINKDHLVEFFETVPNTPSNPVSANPAPTTPGDPDIQLMFGGVTDSTTGNSFFDELKKPYSIYNWELFFHLPLSIAESLSKSQQFETALQWYHYVFNPIIDKGTGDKRWWRFVPFQNTDAKEYLTTLFNSLKPNTPDTQITKWRDDPFNPHAIARLRPSAYMKKTVMSYLDNLIAWGDYLFTQHTIESINQATQLYIFASHILGPRPQVIPKRGKIKPESFNSLLNKWDAFSNAVVELELVFPFSNQIADESEIDPTDGNQVYPNIFGFASALYFCIPGNPELITYWDTVEDRLYKIRHCENIEGVFGLPPLWDPPIDPALLVQAAAAGLSLDSVLNDLSSPLPNYRFNYLVSKALELCNELKSMGNSLLSIFEKKDGEALAKMRARHEIAVNNLVMEVKKKQVEEANSALDGLNQNRLGPVYRMQHYLKLIGEDLSKVPSSDTAFSEISDAIEAPIDESGFKLISYEKEEMDKASDAQDWQKDIGIVETVASILHLIPHFAADVKPVGVGAGLAFGGMELGVAMEAVAKGLQIKAGELSFQSSQAQRKAGFLRQMQDRVLQANNAGYEIKQIDKQILSQQIRIEIANQEITNQQQVIDNSNEVLEFLTDKYTNEELYGWIQDNIKSLHYQVYKLGYDLAKKAEKIYCFERGLSTSNFIQFGYWDSGHDGLLAGERLYLGIKQLEAAFQEKRGYDYEIIKNVSLRQLDPIALLNLRLLGKCNFELPEVLFDIDFPGHYMRKIKSVSISIPCIVGPYTGVNATLRLTENKFRLSSLVSGNSYAEKTDEEDLRFSTVNVPITAIAASTAQNDSGVFELNFKDERYMPFEGAGAISKWSLQLPDQFRQFDYETITDVIINIRYTSIEGGDALKGPANIYVSNYLKGAIDLSDKEGLFGVFDLKHDYANEWYKTFEMTAGATGRAMVFGNLLPRLPILTKLFKVTITDVFLAATTEIKNSDLSLVNKNNSPIQFGGPVPVGNMNLFHQSDVDAALNSSDNWSMTVADTAVEPAALWMILKYTLKQ